ncbi:MAG: tripartite tricarboxylate transporter substrate binding protein [Betaproteobacteria bacterium]|nr:tripartite tricarboxylate transporter substrate binding protein [Betaproteobacteria bacterium]
MNASLSCARRWLCAPLLACIAAHGGATLGQDYPSKPVRIVTSEAGGGNDFAARLIANGLSRNLGQQIIVDNRGGASGMIAGDIVAKAPPDGYTLLLYSGTIWIVPLLQQVPLNPLKDFSPITLAVSSPNILVVHPSLPVKSAKELIALAKARPGELNYASVGTGSGSHLSAELFKSMAGIQVVRIQYKGSAPALNDLLGGRVEFTFGTSGSTASHVASGRLRALAVTSAQPSAVFPGLSTVAASGLPGYEYRNTYSLFAPAGASAALVSFLNQQVLKVLNTAEVKERFFKSGVEVIGSSPEQLAATMKAETSSMGKVIREAGIRAD